MLQNSRFKRASTVCPALALLLVASLLLGRPSRTSAQNAASADERLKALEHERDDLKKRNGVLELRLKQLQATVNQQVRDALAPALDGPANASPPTPHPPGEAPSNAPPSPPVTNPFALFPRRMIGPDYNRFTAIVSPLQSPADVVGLAVAYQDALGEQRRARQAKDSKENRPGLDVESAESKVRMLRSITKIVRDQIAGEVDRMHKLGAVHAIPMMDVRNMDTKLKILDLILAQDPDAGPVSNEPTSEQPIKPPGK
jgi:hypothetical protein